jgi:hypothetical protein
MSEDANNIETPTETTAEAPASQPAQGNETPATPQVQETGSAPQGQSESQQSPMIPKWRFDQVNEQLKAERLARSQYQQPAAQPQQPAQTAPKEEDFADWGSYQKAVIAHEVRLGIEQDRQAQRQQQQQQAMMSRVQSIESNWAQKSQEAGGKYQDFEQKIATSPALTNSYALEALKASPMAGDLAYHLASNHALVQQLNGMHPLDAAAELGRIEAKLAGSNAGQPAPKKPSAGIPALEPLGAGNKPGNIDPYALNTSVEDYVRATRPPPRRR